MTQPTPSRPVVSLVAVSLALAATLGPAADAPARIPPEREWRAHGGDPGHTQHSPLAQITPRRRHVRAYDVRSGAIRWTFHTIPKPGEPGHDTWPADAWKTVGGANAWSGISVDHARGLVFLPTGSPAWDFWGGDRHGANLFGNCVLALRAATGERVWHYQPVPVKPPAFARQSFTEDDATDISPASRAAVLERLRQVRSAGSSSRRARGAR